MSKNVYICNMKREQLSKRIKQNNMQQITYINKDGIKVKVTAVEPNNTQRSNERYISEDGIGFSSKNSMEIFFNENGFYMLEQVMGSKGNIFNKK